MHKNGNGNEKGKKYRDFIFVQVPRLHGNEPHFCAVFVQNENEQTRFNGEKGKNCDEAGARGEKFGTSEEPERAVLELFFRLFSFPFPFLCTIENSLSPQRWQQIPKFLWGSPVNIQIYMQTGFKKVV